MCKFLSAIAFKNGDIICDPNVDSHEDLIQENGLKETKMRNWVKIEYYPDSEKDYQFIEKYNLHIDDDLLTWISEEMKGKWIEKLKAKLSKIIITENRHVLSSGTYILSDGVCIERCLYVRIISGNKSTVKSGGYMTVENGGSMNVKYGGSMTVKNGGSMNVKYGGSMIVEYGGSMTVENGDSMNVKNGGYMTVKYGDYMTVENEYFMTFININNAKIIN